MFKNPFSFRGRIRRLELGISLIIICVLGFLINGIMILKEIPVGIFYLLFIPFIWFPSVWFMIAQGTKRCHDRGNSGWYQVIPCYYFWMLFAKGDYGKNKYGSNPKKIIKKYRNDTRQFEKL